MPAQDERTPLLRDESSEPEIIEFGKEDPGNPKAWPRSKKLANIAVIAMMSGKTDISIYTFAAKGDTKLMSVLCSSESSSELDVYPGHQPNCGRPEYLHAQCDWSDDRFHRHVGLWPSRPCPIIRNLRAEKAVHGVLYHFYPATNSDCT